MENNNTHIISWRGTAWFIFNLDYIRKNRHNHTWWWLPHFFVKPILGGSVSIIRFPENPFWNYSERR